MPSYSPETDQNADDWSSKVAAKTRFRRRLFRRICDAPPLGTGSSHLQQQFPTNQDHRGRRKIAERSPESFGFLELRSAVAAARGSTPAAPLDSPRPELADLSSPSPLTEVRSPLTGKGQFGKFMDLWSEFVISCNQWINW